MQASQREEFSSKVGFNLSNFLPIRYKTNQSFCDVLM